MHTTERAPTWWEKALVITVLDAALWLVILYFVNVYKGW